MLTRSGHVPADSLYRLFYVPVAVPPGTAELRVQESYNHLAGGNVLNMGIYDPRGYQAGSQPGFRGWSGGAKTSFFINAHNASAGYVPGPVPAGTWHVLLYPSTIAPAGIDWQLTVTLVPGPAATPAFGPAPAPAVAGTRPGWYQGDLHLHTLHSDGQRTPQELVDEAGREHLDFLISTEHNTNSANLSWGRYARPGLLLLNGEEVTTTAFGHWNALGLDATTLIDWRYAAADTAALAQATARVHAVGGLAIINHPYFPDTVRRFVLPVRYFDGVEVWNGRWNERNERALAWWDALLRQGRPLLAVANSDTHTAAPSPNELGRPRTVVQASALSRAGIMRGLRARRAYLVAGRGIRLALTARSGAATAGIGDTLAAPTGTVQVALTVTGTPGCTLTLHGSQGQLASGPAPAASWQVPARGLRYLRAEVRDAQGQVRALSNPIWVREN